MRLVVVLSLVLALALPAAAGRVVILGFDGVDPKLAQGMIDAGELPNLKALAESGTFVPLESSNPPQSPTAWSSFATSKTPGAHGIYDFLRRTPANYRPGVGFGSVKQPVLAGDGALATPPSFENIRQGDSFWYVANQQGAKCKILSVPFAFPAEDLAESCMLCGLGVPDVRGTTSTFFYFKEDAAEVASLSGGKIMPLKFTGDSATAAVDGLRVPGSRDYATANVSFKADRAANNVTVSVGDQTATLGEGEWTPWFEWSFELSPNYTVKAISRFHCLEAGDNYRLSLTCLQFHPEEPFMQFTSPPEYGAELKERYGFFKTIGWIYDTHALRQDAMTEDLFLADVAQTMEWREKLTLDELDRGEFDLLISAWTGTDRVGHMFWRFRDPEHPLYTAEGNAKYGRAVEDTYKKMDAIVGKVQARLNDDDVLMIVSDHGFHSFRRGFNVNTWLIREGYLAVEGKNDAATATNMQPFLFGYDWPRTKAYSLGLGSIFLNLKGREGQGAVDPGQADALIKEIQGKLEALTDPKTGDKVFDAVYTRDYYEGAMVGDAPDIQLGYAEGYQSTKDAAKGSAPDALFEDNLDKWSGEHAASDVKNTPGILFLNRPLAKENPKIIDVGVTALKALGKDVPADFEGTAFLD